MVDENKSTLGGEILGFEERETLDPNEEPKNIIVDPVPPAPEADWTAELFGSETYDERKSIKEGTSNDDSIYGSYRGNDVLIGNDGDDYIISGIYGHDDILGGRGNDQIYALYGDDRVSGGFGDDYIDSSQGDDIVSGGGGDDHIELGKGDDIVDAGHGNDLVNGEVGDDLIYGGYGNDQLNGMGDEDLIYGGYGNDIINGGDDDDILYGEGDDKLDGGEGIDYLTATGGNNEFYDLHGGGDRFEGGTGVDKYHIQGVPSGTKYVYIEDFERQDQLLFKQSAECSNWTVFTDAELFTDFDETSGPFQARPVHVRQNKAYFCNNESKCKLLILDPCQD